MSDMWANIIDRSIYDHPGAVVTMNRSIRKWKNRPAIKEGAKVTIIRLTFEDTGYTMLPKLLVSDTEGNERWVYGTDVTDLPEPHKITQTH